MFAGDLSLVAKSKARHHAYSAKLGKPFEFKSKPFILQYEVQFRNGQECGGAYLKLLTNSGDLNSLNDKTQYSIMFGPDKCGNDNKLHFIFNHKNPKNGSITEKHWKRASSVTNLEEVSCLFPNMFAMQVLVMLQHVLGTVVVTLSFEKQACNIYAFSFEKLTTSIPFMEIFKDNRWHQLRLELYPDNTFQVSLDKQYTQKGHLLEDFVPPVNPPKTIDDPNDVKPEDWDEREKIPDPDAGMFFWPIFVIFYTVLSNFAKQ